ncbi:MAG TPA: hypothetical protein IAB44_02580 [Candidatus Limivivens intestinipullorum]|uniref:Nucleotide modification associated domain-containing protein n=1 Tax=Candidatus Limivivens intestinipullorum TaxID=2840858 RepID=A0A9D1JJ84_9FIRM|nr:hypothetical protein [Candidatus Limivivens intestinipullorum]
MKIILSRKGFDSSYGGYPSFIFQNGLLQPLPIPSSYETIRYSDIYSPYDGLTLYDTMRSLNAAIKDKTWVGLTKDQTCHLDPDLGFDSLSRCGEWVGCFGQEGAAQTVLRKQLVGSGDIFLFFGWFNHCYPSDHGLKFRKGDGSHVIFGYLQVEKVLYTAEEEIPQWLKYHPHAHERHIKKRNNCIYVARKYCSWNHELKGYGLFNYSDALCLTKNGCSRSKWNLPEIFRDVRITYHSTDNWKDGYFQSAYRGQEFVIEENSEIEKWAVSLIEKNSRR